MSPHNLAVVLNTLPLYLIVALLALIVIWLYTPRLRLAPAPAPAMQAAPVAPTPRPRPMTGRIDRISARPEDVETLKRFGYVVKHEGRESVFMVKQLDTR